MNFVLKTTASALMLVAAATVLAEGIVTYQTMPDGSRDYRQQAVRTESNGTSYYIRPDGARDFTKPTFKTDSNGITRQLNRDGSIDYRQPATKSVNGKR